jgi:hypothetical protein
MLSSISFNYCSNIDFIILSLVSFFFPFKVCVMVSYKENFSFFKRPLYSTKFSLCIAIFIYSNR